MDSKKPLDLGSKSDGLIAGSSILSGLAALIGASCCVLPLLLVNLGVGSALVGNLDFFAKVKPYFMGATLVLVAIGFLAAFWGGRRPGKRILTLLVLAAALAVGAYMLPFYEPQILRWMGNS